MLKKSRFFGCIVLLLFLTTFLFTSCFPRKGELPTIEITIKNPLPIKRTNVPIVLKISEIRKVAKDFSPDLYIITPNEKPEKGQQPVKIPCQADDMDYDGVIDEIIFLVDLEPEETKTVLLYYPPADQREKVTFGHTKQTRAGIFPKLGGTALESELAAYLINSQNAVSPLGKSASGLMLNGVRSQGKTEMFPIIEPGKQSQIGCGGFAFWKADTLLPLSSDRSERYMRVLSDGPVRSAVEVIYPNHNVSGGLLDISATFSVTAGHREMKTQLELKGDKPLPQIATGLPYALTDQSRGEGYAYSWNSSKMTGTALIYPIERFSEIIDNAFIEGMRRLRKKPTAIFNLDGNGSLTYHTLATAGRGEIAIENQSEFESLISVTTARINSPPIVNIRLSTKGEDGKNGKK